MYYLESHSAEPAEYTRSFAPFDVLGVLWRRKGHMAVTVPLALLLGAVAYHFWVPTFLSEAQLLVVKKAPQLIPGVDTRFAAMEDTLAVHAAVIRSPLLLGEAIREGQLNELPSLQGEEDITKTLIEGLSVSPSSRISNQDSSALLNLTYVSTSSEDSVVVLEAVVRSYEEFLKSMHRAGSEESAALYQQWRDEVQDELAAKQEAYDKLAETDLVLAMGTPADTNVAQSRLDRADSALLEKSIRRTELENQLRTLKELQAQGANPAILGELIERWQSESGRYRDQRFRERLIELQLMEQTMISKYGDRHPDLVAVRSQLELLQGAEVDQPAEPGKMPIDVYASLIEQELKGIRNVEQSLGELVGEEHAQVEKLAKKRYEFETIRSEIERIQDLHTEIVKQVQGVDLVKEAKSYQAQLITPPKPGEKVSPSAPVFALVFSFLGICGGAAIALYREMSDESVGSAGEVRYRLNIPVLGQIPRFRRTRRNSYESVLCTHHQPNSADAEAFRRLRTAIYFREPGERSSLLQITSPDAGDGTSTIAANLAVSMAQSGKSVVLIDANLRNPAVASIFGLTATVGLANLLSGTAEIDEALCQTEIPGLVIIPAGSEVDKPAELLSSIRLPRILDAVAAKFDYVLIDTPSVMEVSDPGMVAPHVDGVLLTVNVANSWPRLVQAKDMLESLNARIIGAAVNGVPQDAPVAVSGPRLEYHVRA